MLTAILALLQRLVQDKASVTKIGAAVAVTSTDYATVKSLTGPAKGRLLGFWLVQLGSSARVPDGVKITVDGGTVESTGLYNLTTGPIVATTAARFYDPLFFPLDCRFKDSFLLEVKGNSTNGICYCTAVWSEEV